MSVQPTYFADIAPIAFKGPDSTDELSYRFYDKDRVVLGKRMACRAASQGLQGQDLEDQIQLCMEQARLDCLKQAIAQQIVDAQRKEFVKSCME